MVVDAGIIDCESNEARMENCREDGSAEIACELADQTRRDTT